MKRSMTRRDFLKVAGVGIGATVLTGSGLAGLADLARTVDFHESEGVGSVNDKTPVVYAGKGGSAGEAVKTLELGANGYLVRTDMGYYLIDTGMSIKRADLKKELDRAGCQPGNLKLIILTHGDTDHAGNCAYLREEYAAPIATHQSESQVVESGDMFLSRKTKSLLATIVYFFTKLSVSDRFKPDFYVEDGDTLSPYGFDARVLHLPGHTQGSIGILTADGQLFCGDLLTNDSGKPGTPSIDDWAAFDASIEKLKSHKITTVFPGHGKPFLMDQFMREHR
jgi:hydroxyacylglutathione hydrolase